MTENYSAKARAERKIAKHGMDTACYHPNGCVVMIFADDIPKEPDFSSITREVSE